MVDQNQGATTPQARAGLMADLVRNARLTWRLLLDPRVATLTKLIIPGLVALYVLSPIDIIPDWILGLGQLDDLAILVLSVKLFIELCPADIVREHRTILAGDTGTRPTTSEGDVVDVEYRIIK